MLTAVLEKIVSSLIIQMARFGYNSIVAQSQYEKELEKAFERALKKWSVNKSFRDNQAHLINEKLRTLKKLLLGQISFESLSHIDKELIEHFQNEVYESQAVSNYINTIQLQEVLIALRDINPLTHEKALEHFEEKMLVVERDLNFKTSHAVEIPILSRVFHDFLFPKESWVVKIQNILQEFDGVRGEKLPDIVKILNDLRQLDKSGSYDQVTAKIGKLISVFRAQHQNVLKDEKVLRLIDSLERLTKKPKYNTCFQITGSYGTGKTHFIIIELAKLVKKKQILPVYINVADGDLFEQLDDSISNILGLKDVSSYKLTTKLKLLSEHFSEVKILVVIEKYEAITSNDATSRVWLLIKESTRFTNVCWILTINSNFLARVKNHLVSFQEYPFEHNDNGESLQIYKWFDLDSINESVVLTNKILDIHVGKTYNEKEIEKLREHSLFYNNEITPLIAWIVVDYVTDALKNLDELQQFDFLQIINTLNERYIHAIPSSTSFDGLIRSICSYVIDKNSLEFEKRELINEIKLYSINKYDIEREELTNLYVDLALGFNLLSNNVKSESKVSLRTYVYWSYYLSDIVHQHFIHNNFRIGKIGSVGIEKNEWFWAEVLEFFLFRVEITSSSIEDCVSHFRSIFEENIVSKGFLWSAGSKMSEKGFKAINKVIVETKDLHSLYDTENDLFLLIRFLGKRCNLDEGLALDRRLEILMRLTNAIKKFKLEEAYTDVCSRIIKKIDSINYLCKVFLYFKETHKLDAAKGIAESCINRLLEISKVDNSEEKIVKRITLYLMKHVVRIEKKRENGIWIRTFFAEWAIHFLCNKLANKLGPHNSYNLFQKLKLYQADELKLDKSIAISLAVEANIGISSLKNHPDFLRFLHSILEVVNPDPENCAHIIRHTVETKGSNAEIHDRFIPIMRTIYTNERWRTHVIGDNKLLNEFFQVNGFDLTK